MIKKLFILTMILMFPIVSVVNSEPKIRGGIGVDYSTQEDVVTNLRVTLTGGQYHFDFDVNQDGIQAKRGYLSYSPNNHVQLRVGNIRTYSGVAASQGYASQWFISQVDGFNRTHKPGVAAVGDYNVLGYQVAYFENEAYLGRLTANVLPNVQVGAHYHSEDERYGLEASAQLNEVEFQVELLPSTEHYYLQARWTPKDFLGVGYRYASIEEESHAVVVTHEIAGIEVAAEYGWSDSDDVMMVSLLKRF